MPAPDSGAKFPHTVNALLGFPAHYGLVRLLDTEWLLSTLFDASLLIPSSRRQRRLLFLPKFQGHRLAFSPPH